jgi:hypothetical protein
MAKGVPTARSQRYKATQKLQEKTNSINITEKVHSTPDHVHVPIIDGVIETPAESSSKASELEQKPPKPSTDSAEPASETRDELDEGGLADAVNALEDEVGTTAEGVSGPDTGTMPAAATEEEGPKGN